MSRQGRHPGSWAGRGAAGKGKRRFAPQGVWRSGGVGADVDPVVWLPRPGSALRIPLPLPQHGPQPKRPKQKDEFYLAELAREFWGPNITPAQRNKANSALVEGIYQTLKKTNFAYRPIMGLEYSQYLENYLWPNFDPDKASSAHLISIVLMVNEKWRERVPPWEAFQSKPEHFPAFFRRVLDACLTDMKEELCSMKERTALLLFLVHSFNSLEVDLIREQVQRLVALPIWNFLLPSRLEQELGAVPKLKKYWGILQKRDQQLDQPARERVEKERQFLSQILQHFFQVLDSIPAQGEVSEDAVSYCERFLELVTDLEAQLPSRRFFNTLLNDRHLIVRCYLSQLVKKEPEGHLFKKLLQRLKFYAGFEINDQTGSALTDHEMTDLHYNKITSLQRAAFKLFPALRSFALSNVASVDTREALLKHFQALDSATLHAIAAHLHLVPAPGPASPAPSSELLVELLVAQHERRPSQLEAINATPLYPTEEILWDENVVPSDFYNGETCLALPKLNLQFLTLHDYLLRNFNLFRLESTYEIREDVEDVVSRMKPWLTTEGTTEFAGWARMALPISSFAVIEVGKPNVGENRPSRVRADIAVELTVGDTVKYEWEGLRKHDVCFLVAVQAKMALREQFDWSKPFVPQVGLAYVRGCEVEGMLDEQGKVIEEGPEPKPQFTTTNRTFRVWLDTNQYQQDMASVVQGGEDPYEAFNIIMRRKPKENNFKAVLETIRDLMNAECVVPAWLHDVFLGYGDPAAACYTRLPNQIRTLNFNDSFLSLDHLQASFPQYQLQCTTEDPSLQVPPFRVTFPIEGPGQKRKHPEDGEGEGQGVELLEDKKTLIVEPYTIANRGPYPYSQPKRNTVPFTPTQVEAIRSGMQPGLTLVVGPPGTGKTDVAVQIISNLYHNFPEQRTLLVTHSNQALNQLFEKIMALDIDERHLLRLGHGEEELQTEKDFSRYGRVNFILSLRLELLKEVERLQESLGVAGDVAYTCETAGHFFLYQVVARWEAYVSKIKPLANKPEGVRAITELFPFSKFFANAPQPVFKGEEFQQDWEIAEGCFRHLKKIFNQLEEFRAFELLRSGRDRINYLLVKEAKIIAMTCTHAALKRRDLVELAFKYDNVLMEEAAQILEVETFIPLMLQNPQDGYNRLKRVIMIGDHHQLPPVIKNMAFQKYSNMEQSMFTRFVRLGVPTIQLDAQGRARPPLCSLYNWRYRSLGNLPHVTQWPEYRVANPGFRYEYQLVNVEDFNGVGESEPNPYFYQNLGEAEFAVALFMFMRLQGYPPDKIAILTTYNGQKHLIRDVLAKRCARNPVFGLPEKVTTVDRYQGQQNDYIILSLVRTKHVGHLRDVRRLVVAMSRARLGLVILARVSLFRGCTELQPAFRLLMKRPLRLHLVPDEFYPSTRPYNKPPTSKLFVVSTMSQLAQYVYQDYHCRMDALRTQRRESSEATDSIALPPVEIKTNGEALQEEGGMQTEGDGVPKVVSQEAETMEFAVQPDEPQKPVEDTAQEVEDMPQEEDTSQEDLPQGHGDAPQEDIPQEGLPQSHGDTPQEDLPQGHGDTPQEGLPQGHGDTPQEDLPQGHGDTPQEDLPQGYGDTPQEGLPQGHGDTPQEDLPQGHGDTPQEGLPQGQDDAPQEPADNTPPKSAEDMPQETAEDASLTLAQGTDVAQAELSYPEQMETN